MIAKFLAAGPCKNAAQALENELKEHRELLPRTITYEGKPVPMTMERIVIIIVLTLLISFFSNAFFFLSVQRLSQHEQYLFA